MRPRARDLGRRPPARARSRGGNQNHEAWLRHARACPCACLVSRVSRGLVVVLGVVGFYPVLSGFIRFIRFYPVLSSFIRFYPVLSGFGGVYRALVGFRGLSWVWVGFSASLLVDVRPANHKPPPPPPHRFPAVDPPRRCCCCRRRRRRRHRRRRSPPADRRVDHPSSSSSSRAPEHGRVKVAGRQSCSRRSRGT